MVSLKEVMISPTPEETRKMEHEHTIFSYNQIEELLFAGNNMCCQGHFEMELISKGVSADISFEAEWLDNPQGAKYFFWLPWQEDTAPAIDLLNLALDILDNLMKYKIKTYAHCKNGHGRTTTFLASYFMRKNRITAEKSLDLVRQRRPSGHINDLQLAFLKEFEKSIKE